MLLRTTACLASYEELMTGFDGWMGRVAAHLAWGETTTARITSRVRGALTPPRREDPPRRKRRMTPGHWREVFDERPGGELEAAGDAW
jgi:hypothetical protein